MDAINMAVLAELKEYAQLYFSAIMEMHTVEGKCNLKPGKYSAKELVDNLKAACGSYGLPTDEIFNEDIEISVETFNCKFPYRRIFAILAQWEAMCKAGKQKAVFEIGEVEEKSAKVLLNEKTECGAFKTKSVKLQRITGNWWMPRKVKKNRPIELYYELNGIMFMPGKQVWSDNPTDPETVKWCERYNDEAMSKLLLSFLGNDREQTQKITPYYAEIANKAKIAATPAETVRIVRVEIVRDFDKSYYANLYDENGGGHNLSKEYTDFRALTSLCKKEYGVNLPNLSQMEFETHGRKSYAYISTETPQIPTGTAEVGNVPVEEEKAEIKPICELYDNSEASPELEFELDAGLYYEWLKRTEKGSYKTIAEKAMAEAWINIFLAAYKRGKGHVLAMNERGELVDTVFVLNNASQPSETPQAVNHTADTSKPRETARKEPRRTISKMERVHAWQKLGAQGYLMLADASAILAVINAPPIRGDCKIGVFQRAKPPNSTLYKKISILQPP